MKSDRLWAFVLFTATLLLLSGCSKEEEATPEPAAYTQSAPATSEVQFGCIEFFDNQHCWQQGARLADQLFTTCGAVALNPDYKDTVMCSIPYRLSSPNDTIACIEHHGICFWMPGQEREVLFVGEAALTPTPED